MRRIFAALGLAAAGLTACAAPQPVYVQPAGAVVTVAPGTTTAAPPVTSYVPPVTSYVPVPRDVAASSQWYAQRAWVDAQPWVPITSSAGQTDCQWLYEHGYTYAQAFAAWAQHGYPANWSATGDGYPCQRTYGKQH